MQLRPSRGFPIGQFISERIDRVKQYKSSSTKLTDAWTAEALGVGEFGIETVVVASAGVGVVDLALLGLAVGVGGGIAERALADRDTVAILLISAGDTLAFSV